MGTKECEGCGENINPKRVEARPNVTTCIHCQEELERSGKFQFHKMDVQAKTRCGEHDSTTNTLVRGSM